MTNSILKETPKPLNIYCTKGTDLFLCNYQFNEEVVIQRRKRREILGKDIIWNCIIPIKLITYHSLSKFVTIPYTYFLYPIPELLELFGINFATSINTFNLICFVRTQRYENMGPIRNDNTYEELSV